MAYIAYKLSSERNLNIHDKELVHVHSNTLRYICKKMAYFQINILTNQSTYYFLSQFSIDTLAVIAECIMVA